MMDTERSYCKDPTWVRFAKYVGLLAASICFGFNIYFIISVTRDGQLPGFGFWSLIWIAAPIVMVAILVYGLRSKSTGIVILGLFLAGTVSLPGLYPANILAVVIAIVLAVYHTVTHTWRAAS